jgi:Family of unknown function (DUF6527)
MSNKSMQGHRIYPKEPDGSLSYEDQKQPGSYGRGAYTDPKVAAANKGRWEICSPDGELGAIGPSWTITEHEDGTITVHPSIWFNNSTGWHGFLERGFWRSC